MIIPAGWTRVVPHESREFVVRREWVSECGFIRIRRVYTLNRTDGSFKGWWWTISDKRVPFILIAVGKEIQTCVTDWVTQRMRVE